VANAIEVLVPDIGGFKDVSVIDVLVKEGQQIDKETPLVTIETEKAAMDVPAPTAGRITQVKVKQGDKVSEGSLILLLEPVGANAGDAAASGPGNSVSAPAETPVPGADTSIATPASTAANAAQATGASSAQATGASSAAPAAARSASVAPPAAVSPPTQSSSVDERAFSTAYASPSVRKFARELGADLGKVVGTGPKARITQEDVKAHVKKILSTPVAPVSALPKVPDVDFAAYGAVEVKPLSRIQKISGGRLQASWLNLPHVTQHDDADITDLDAARSGLKAKAAEEEVKLTPLVFIIRACLVALKAFPRFNSSLDASGQNLVLKQYFNIGFAADTPNGLVVPVIRDADRLSIYEIARALGALSSKARAGKLTAAEMQGGSFTISSLGGIGGTAFTPIINAPEVAILGVSKSTHKPVFVDGAFVPRLMLPLSLSYDHRVIDGAEAARFVVFLAKTLNDVKALL
jgi:pyruvate dehydrogenase E2 component (dihydrolipoamide acetyltransferase)